MTAVIDMFPETKLRPEDQPDDRYTLRETMSLCQSLAQVPKWDLDAAACAESHWADAYFTREHDGLLQEWRGNVWCNPPFSNLEAWVSKAWAEADSGRARTIAMLLPSNRSEQPFWQALVEPFRDRPHRKLSVNLTVHFLPTRIKFGIPGNPLGVGVGSPPFGCALLVWRRP